MAAGTDFSKARMRVTFLSLLAVVAHAGRHNDEPSNAPAAAPQPSSHGSGSITSRCTKAMSITNEFSKLTVKGALNGHPIELSKSEEARPGGDINVDLSIPCPMSDEDLLSPFEFTVNSIGSLLIYPQEDLTVMAAKVVSIQVDHLQISVRTPSPLSVTLTNEGPTFASTNGLEMTVTSGVATALRQSFDLTGYTTTVPFNGYFAVSEDGSGELTLHLTDFDADFPVEDEKLKLTGNFEVIGWITALSSSAGRLINEHVRARVLEGAAAAASAPASKDGRLANLQAISSVAAVAAIAAVAAVLAMAVRRSLRPVESQPLRVEGAADSTA